MKKTIARTLAAALLLSSFAGCAGRTEPFDPRVPEEYRDREVLEVTCFYTASYYGVKDVIEEFNRAQEEYYALYVQFGEEALPSTGELSGGEQTAPSDTGYTVDFSPFDRAILSGEVGDIVILPTQMDYAKYAEKGVFADLYDTLEPETLDNLFGCVTTAFEYDEALPVIPSDFRLRTLTAKTSAAEHWNTEECLRLAETTRLANIMNTGNLLNILLYNSLGGYVDLENKTCDFGEAFVRVLEFAKHPAGEDLERVLSIAGYPDYRNDTVLVHQTAISSFEGYVTAQLRFGGDAAFCGYPTPDGGKNQLEADGQLYAIHAKTDHPDAAAAFLETALTTAAERNQNGSFPVLRSEYREVMEERKKLYFYFSQTHDEFEVFPEPIPEEDLSGDFVLTPVTDDLIGEIAHLLDSIDVVPYIPGEIREIVEEEVTAYLAGTSTAEETADRITSRVNLHLNERA